MTASIYSGLIPHKIAFPSQSDSFPFARLVLGILRAKPYFMPRIPHVLYLFFSISWFLGIPVQQGVHPSSPGGVNHYVYHRRQTVVGMGEFVKSGVPLSPQFSYPSTPCFFRPLLSIFRGQSFSL